MAAYGAHWSSESDSDESGTSYQSEDSQASQSDRLEPARILGETFQLPQGLCDNPEIFKDVLGMDTWANFSVEQKQHLQNFLPSFPEDDAGEKEKTLQMLFGRENFRFGNPLSDFHKNLQAGNFRPDVVRMRALLRKAQRKDYKRAERWRIFELLKSVLSSRQRLIDSVVNGEKPKPAPPPAKRPRHSHHSLNVKTRYFQELSHIREEVGESDQSSEDEVYPGPAGASLGLKKFRRSTCVAELMENSTTAPVVGTLCTGPNPWGDPTSKHQNNPYAHPEQSYTQILSQHTKRRANREDHPDLHTEGMTLHDVAMRCKFLKKSISKPVVQKKIKMKVARPNSLTGPAVEEEGEDGTEMEEPLFIKHEIKNEDEEESKVDIEALDELPLPSMQTFTMSLNKSTCTSPSNSHSSFNKHHSSTNNSKIASLLLNKKIKLEPPEPPLKKTVSLADSEFKKSRSDSMENRKVKCDTVDSFIRKLKMESDTLASKKVKVEPVEVPLTKMKTEPAPTPLPSTSLSPSTPVATIPSVTAVTISAPVPSTSSHLVAALSTPQPTILSTPVKLPSSRTLTPATLSDLDGYDMMDLPIDFDETPTVDLDDVKPHPELMQETHACFFSLIRDILLSTPDHRIEMKELEQRVRAWANSPIGPINQWYALL